LLYISLTDHTIQHRAQRAYTAFTWDCGGFLAARQTCQPGNIFYYL